MYATGSGMIKFSPSTKSCVGIGKFQTTKTHTAITMKYSILKQSFSATARPLDNAVAETFFSTFKREEAYRKDYTSEQHFRRSVEEYIRFYNEVRPHQTLNYKTPQAFEDAYKPVLSESAV